MSELGQTLQKVNQTLESGTDLIEQYRALNPELDLYARLLMLVQGLGIELENRTDDLFRDLSKIPDTFSDILEDVNLLVSSNDDLISVTVVSKIPDSFGQTDTFTDTNFVVALIKAFSHVRGGALDKRLLFSTSITSYISGHSSGVYMLQLVDGALLEFHSGLSVEPELSHPVEELVVGFRNKYFEVVGRDDVTNTVSLKWHYPYCGRILLVEYIEDEDD